MNVVFHNFKDSINYELDELAISNNYQWFVGILYDYAIIAIAIILSLYSWWLYPISITLIGSRQRALATLLHDAAHQCLCRSSKLNVLVGKYLAGYLILQSFKVYVNSHVVNHHRFLGDPQKDPDYDHYIKSGLFKNESKIHFIFKNLFLPFLGSKTISFIIYLVKNRLYNSKIKNKTELCIVIFFWLSILSLFCWYGFLFHLMLFWFVPLFFIFPIIGWFIEMAEHYPIIAISTKELNMTWNRFSHPIESFFLSIHNENYHLTHHIRPDIPYWNIEKAHKVMLKDSEYKNINAQMGGVFFSSNKAPSLWQRIFKDSFSKELPTYE